MKIYSTHDVWTVSPAISMQWLTEHGNNFGEFSFYFTGGIQCFDVSVWITLSNGRNHTVFSLITFYHTIPIRRCVSYSKSLIEPISHWWESFALSLAHSLVFHLVHSFGHSLPFVHQSTRIVPFRIILLWYCMLANFFFLDQRECLQFFNNADNRPNGFLKNRTQLSTAVSFTLLTLGSRAL